MTSASAEQSAVIEEGDCIEAVGCRATANVAGNSADAAEAGRAPGRAEASALSASPSSLPDPWLRDKLAALQLARLYEPLPQRFQEPLRTLLQLLRQSE